jgi:NAD(P)-dependent dehydrogenase (short-subunit alcohol dehydrogenase family)
MKTIIVTGANSGLGLWTTKYLLDLDFKVIMGCRNIEKAKLAIANFPEFDKTKKFTIQPLDLASFQSIAHFVTSLSKDEQIYGLDCNAGITYDDKMHYTKNGIEATFGVNHIGHFYLTNLLLAKFYIQKIVIISSALHDPTNKSPLAKAVYGKVQDMAYPKMDSNTTIKKQNQMFYSTSKLCNVLFAYELNRRLKGETIVNAFNPGLMPTTNFGKTSKMLNRILSSILYAIGKILGIATNPEKSAKYVVRLLNEETRSGQYFDEDKSIKSSIDSYDETKAYELWKNSDALIHYILQTGKLK